MDALDMLLSGLASDMERSAKMVETMDDAELDRNQYLSMSALAKFRPVCAAADLLLSMVSVEKRNRMERGPERQLEYLKIRKDEYLKADREKMERITCVVCGIHEVSLSETVGGNFSLSVHFQGSKATLNPGWRTEIPFLCRACAKKMPAPWNRILAVPEESAGFTGLSKV